MVCVSKQRHLEADSVGVLRVSRCIQIRLSCGRIVWEFPLALPLRGAVTEDVDVCWGSQSTKDSLVDQVSVDCSGKTVTYVPGFFHVFVIYRVTNPLYVPHVHSSCVEGLTIYYVVCFPEVT